jgi:hypothetical protein
VDGGHIGALHKALSAGDAAYPVDQIGSSDVPADDALNRRDDLVANLLVIFRNPYDSAACRTGFLGEQLHIRPKAGCDQDDSPAQALKRAPQPGKIFTLGDNAHIFFKRQGPGGAGTEDDLVICENDPIHRALLHRSLLPRALLIGTFPYSSLLCLQFGQPLCF